MNRRPRGTSDSTHEASVPFSRAFRTGRRPRLLSPPPPPPAAGLRRLAVVECKVGQRDDAAQGLEPVHRVRHRRGGDEMLLKARLYRGLDLLDAAHDILYLEPCSPVEKRDPRTCAGGVARRCDIFE